MGDGTSLMRAGGSVNAIVPQSFEEAWRVAGALAASGLTPKDINTQEKVLAVIMAGAEIGMAPFQALQSFAVINGRPALWGDGMMAVARKYGVKVEEVLAGEGDAMTAMCVVRRPDTGEVIERKFTVADAKKAGLWGKQGPWSAYPQRMLQMRARAWALRDGCADMLRGMKMAEEIQDIVEVVRDEPIPEMDMSRPEVEKVVNPDTGRLVDPYSPNQLRKTKWPEFTDKLQHYGDAADLEGLKTWFASEEVQEDLAKWPRSWRENAELEFARAHDALEAAQA